MLRELATRKQLAEGGLKLGLAFALAMVVVPTTYQVQLPLSPGVPAYSMSEALYPASAFQQAVPIAVNVPWSYTTLANALDQYFAQALAQQKHYFPNIALQSASLNAGQNITFVVRAPSNLTQAQSGTPGLYVFVVDPEGAVVATSPSNPSMIIGSGGGGAPSYSFEGVSALTLNAIYPLGLKFTWGTPAGDQSVGTWRVYVFMSGGSGPAMAAAESNVQVGQAGGLGALPGFFARVALFFGAYQAEGSIIAGYRKHADVPRWLRDNALWLVAAVALLAFLYLAYLG